MANTKSAEKNARKSARRTLRNKSVRSRLKTLARRVEEARAGGDAQAAAEVARSYASALDKAARGGVIHPNAAGRRKSRLAKPPPAAPAA